MRIWLVKTGEPLPLTGNERLLRTGIIADVLQRRGHEVIWWTSTFDHIKRSQRTSSNCMIEIGQRYRIKMLHSPGYRNSISLSRIWDHFILGQLFKKVIVHETPPDIILCALPTIELAKTATEYGRHQGIPVILDLRDMWPDIFLEPIPRALVPLAYIALRPMFHSVEKACRNATALIGITDEFLEWGLKYACREKTELDRVFPLAHSPIPLNPNMVEYGRAFWKKHGIGETDNTSIILCFFGTMGHQLDIETVIEAAKRLLEIPVKIVLCGDGDSLERYRKMADGCINLIFPGWVGAGEIRTLMSLASAGLAPYRSSPSFIRSIPNKAIEYLSAGLPIVTSLDGKLRTLIDEYKCGYWYRNGDVDGLVSIVLRMYKNREELKGLSVNSTRVYNERFNAGKIYGQLADYLEIIANEGRRHSKRG